MRKQENSLMHRTTALLLFGAAVVVAAAACSGGNPTEVRNDPNQFPIVAHWTATATPVDTATVSGQLTFNQHLGFHSDVTFIVTGPPNKAFQWRIFKRDCSVNVAAVNNTATTGLVLFATTASYPDITLDATGTATITTVIAGWLDSLTPYSVRIRPTATTSFTGVDPASCGNLQYAK
jgi:hypothetical protein